MPAQRPNRLIAWYLLVKDEWLPSRWTRFAEWRQAVREEPRLIWETANVRYAVYGLAGAVALVVVLTTLDSLVPTPPGARAPARTADFHVVCSRAECRRHFVIHEKFGYSRFPVVCPQCGKETGQRALRCRSAACGGRYVAPIESDSRLHCPLCGADLGPVP